MAPAPQQLRATEDPPPEWLVRNVLRWLPLIHRWHPDFLELDPALVLAVMAAESQGFPYVESPIGAVGLMQVIPRSWTGTRTKLLEPAYNIFTGMEILDFATQKWGVRLGLAHYNCSEKGVANDACGSRGGVHYADRILDYWLLVFRAELSVVAGENDLIGNWLKELGYEDGFGKWDEAAEERLAIRRFIPY